MVEVFLGGWDDFSIDRYRRSRFLDIGMEEGFRWGELVIWFFFFVVDFREFGVGIFFSEWG